jgi:hypothetical protein
MFMSPSRPLFDRGVEIISYEKRIQNNLGNECIEKNGEWANTTTAKRQK